MDVSDVYIINELLLPEIVPKLAILSNTCLDCVEKFNDIQSGKIKYEEILNGKNNDIEAKDTEVKDTEAKDTEAKDTEAKDTEAKDTEAKDTEAKGTYITKYYTRSDGVKGYYTIADDGSIQKFIARNIVTINGKFKISSDNMKYEIIKYSILGIINYIKKKYNLEYDIKSNDEKLSLNCRDSGPYELIDRCYILLDFFKHIETPSVCRDCDEYLEEDEYDDKRMEKCCFLLRTLTDCLSIIRHRKINEEYIIDGLEKIQNSKVQSVNIVYTSKEHILATLKKYKHDYNNIMISIVKSIIQCLKNNSSGEDDFYTNETLSFLKKYYEQLKVIKNLYYD